MSTRRDFDIWWQENHAGNPSFSGIAKNVAYQAWLAAKQHYADPNRLSAPSIKADQTPNRD